MAISPHSNEDMPGYIFNDSSIVLRQHEGEGAFFVGNGPDLTAFAVRELDPALEKVLFALHKALADSFGCLDQEIREVGEAEAVLLFVSLGKERTCNVADILVNRGVDRDLPHGVKIHKDSVLERVLGRVAVHDLESVELVFCHIQHPVFNCPAVGERGNGSPFPGDPKKEK